MSVNSLRRVSCEFGNLKGMKSFVDHFRYVAAADRAPGNPLVDTGKLAYFSKRPVDLRTDSLDAAVKFGLGGVAAFDRRKDVIHISLAAVSLDNLCR